MEADLLNCCVLGPDVTTDKPEFDIFIKEVVQEITTRPDKMYGCAPELLFLKTGWKMYQIVLQSARPATLLATQTWKVYAWVHWPAIRN